jgi:hypothetical protein
MCFLYVIAGVGILLTVLSGQYSDHTLLFWAFVVSTFITGFFYSLQHRMADATGQGLNNRLRLTIEFGTGTSGFATLGLFIWLIIVIWI